MHIKVISTIMLVIVVIVCFYLLKDNNLKVLVSFLTEHAFIALIFLLITYILKPILFFLPTSVQMCFAGVVFPWHLAILINTFGIVLETISGYLIGFAFGEKLVTQFLDKNPKLKSLLNKYMQDNFNAIFITHFVPIFPFNNINMVFGSRKTDLNKYIIASVIGLAPRIVAFSISGAYISDPLSPQFILPLAIIAVFSLIVTYLFNKKERLKNTN